MPEYARQRNARAIRQVSKPARCGEAMPKRSTQPWRDEDAAGGAIKEAREVAESGNEARAEWRCATMSAAAARGKAQITVRPSQVDVPGYAQTQNATQRRRLIANIGGEIYHAQ